MYYAKPNDVAALFHFTRSIKPSTCVIPWIGNGCEGKSCQRGDRQTHFPKAITFDWELKLLCKHLQSFNWTQHLHARKVSIIKLPSDDTCKEQHGSEGG